MIVIKMKFYDFSRMIYQSLYLPLSKALDVPLSTSNVKPATTSACLAIMPALSMASAPRN